MSDDCSVVRQVRDQLGAQLVAHIAGQASTAPVHNWAEERGAACPADVLEGFRVALAAASILGVRDTPEVAQAWMQGKNPRLGDRSPARLLRDGDPGEVGPEIISAARDFGHA